MQILRFTNAAHNRSLRSMRYLAAIVVAGALVLLGANIARTQQSKTEANTRAASRRQNIKAQHPDPAVQTAYAPTIGVGKFSEGELVLNNRGPASIDVTPTFFSSSGGPILGKTLTLEQSEVRHLSIADLIPADHKAEQMGGMTVTYFGGMMEVAEQITLFGRNGARSVDIPFSGTMDYHSAVQEAVWWMPKEGEANIILGNATDVPIVASLKYSDGQSQEVSLGPFATEVVQRSLSTGDATSSKGFAQSVRIELSGPMGSLRATGFVTSSDKSFQGAIRFYDPGAIRQPNLFATNLPPGKSGSHLVLKNIGDGVVSVRPRFIPASGESGGALELPAVSIPAQQAIEVDLRALRKAANRRSDFDVVSVQVKNESGSNNLIGALYSSDSTAAGTADVPLVDSGPVNHSTGSYPWRLDGEYSTLVSITNTLAQPTRYRATIKYKGGTYSPNLKELAAGETTLFDLRKIRDEQIPDKDGSVIPGSVTGGQFSWSLIGGDTLRLIGRAQVISPSSRVSSNFSCPVCCPDSFSGLAITPGSSVGPVGGIALLAVDGFLTDCYFYQYGPYAWSVSGWFVENPSVISLAMVSQGSAQMGCLSLGQSQFSGTTNETWYENDGMDCYSRNSPFSDGCCAAVVSVTIGDFAGVGKDQTADVQVTLTPSPIQGGVTLELSATSGSGVAKFDSNGLTTLNISQTTTVTIRGKTESSTANNMKLDAKATSQSLGFKTFTVVKVDLSLRTGDSNTVSMDNAGRADYFSCTGSVSLGTYLTTGDCARTWSTGVEVVGTVLPSNFSGLIVIHRTLVDKRVYDGNNNLIENVSNQGDDSDPGFRDDDPQSGGSNGRVYDLDGPGVGTVQSDPTGTVRRKRANYRQWATLGSNGGKVSGTSDLLWFSRVSVIKIGSSDQLRTDVDGDNIAGSGSTNLTWNLQ